MSAESDHGQTDEIRGKEPLLSRRQFLDYRFWLATGTLITSGIAAVEVLLEEGRKDRAIRFDGISSQECEKMGFRFERRGDFITWTSRSGKGAHWIGRPGSTLTFRRIESGVEVVVRTEAAENGTWDEMIFTHDEEARCLGFKQAQGRLDLK